MPTSSIVYINAPHFLGRQVGGQRETRRLRRLHAGTHQQKGEGGGYLANPKRPVRVAGQNQQGERHDGQSAELQHRTHPDVGHAPPAERGLMIVGTKTDQGAEGRKYQRQSRHQCHQPCRHAEFDDEHSIQSADQQHHGHAHAYLEKRQAQQPPEGQLGSGGLRKRHELRAELHPFTRQLVTDNTHDLLNSRAWDL